MANAPTTRPPNRPWSDRRPPRGPATVPASRDDQKRIANLKKASAHLRSTGAPEELADTVDFVLTDEGARFLNRMRWGSVADGNPNLAMSVTPELRARLKALASENGKKLDQIVQEGFARYIDGTWVPPQPVKAKSGAGVEKVNLNIRTDAGQRTQLAQLKPARSAELGFKVADAWIALAWLLEEFGIDTEELL